MKRFMVLLVAGAVVFSLTGCGRRDGEVLAKIDGEVITLREFNRKIERLPEHYQEIIKSQKRQFLDDLIMEELLYQEAIRSKLDKNPETEEIIAEAKRKILVSRLIKDRVNDKISISEEDIKRYYDEHSEEFMLPERWRASHILVDTKEEAEEIKKALSEGKSFEMLAKEWSKDASARQGGDIGYFSKGQLVPEFEEACLLLKEGKMSEIVQTQFGYHIIKLTDRKGPEVQEYSVVKDIIRKEMEREKRKGLVEELANNLRKAANITVNEELVRGAVATEVEAGEIAEEMEMTEGEE